jgi:hypothetical protein
MDRGRLALPASGVTRRAAMSVCITSWNRPGMHALLGTPMAD